MQISTRVGFIVSDVRADSLSDAETVTITVGDWNRAPYFNDIGDQSIDLDSESVLSFTVTAIDPDGDPLAYEMIGGPDNTEFVNQTFRWEPTKDDIDLLHTVSFRVSDDKNLSDEMTIAIRVSGKKEFPILNPNATPALIQSNFVNSQTGEPNFELLATENGKLRHWYREVTTDASGNTAIVWHKGDLFGNDVGSAPALMQSTYGTKGNFEVIYQEGDRLRHWYRINDEEPFEWKQGELFGQNITSAPALIQSSYGNLEVVVREGGLLRHYFRTENEKDRFQWQEGEFLSSRTVDSAPALIESSFGNLEVVAVEGNRIRHWFRDAQSLKWQEGDLFGDNASSTPAFIQSTYGNNGNFEVIYREGDRLRHWYRNNDEEPLEWKQGELFGQNITSAPALMQSSYGNLEVVVREGDQLRHYFRTGNEKDGFEWTEGEFLSTQILDSPPALIESSFDNLEVIIGEGNQLRHWFRDAQGLVWQKADLFGQNVSSGPGFIQSNYGVIGNFEVIYREGDRLRHWYRNNDEEPFEWKQDELVGQNITSAPALIQSSYGNLEVVVREGGLLRHYFRTENEQDRFQWQEGEFLSSKTVDSAPALIESSFGNLEVVAVEGNRIRHWFRDAQSLKWQEGDLFGDNASSTPAFIQSTYGNNGNFEVIYREGDRLRHWYRNNDEEPLEWKQGELFGQNITSAPALMQSSYGNLEVVVREGDQLRHYFRTGNEKDGFEWTEGEFLSTQILDSPPALIESSFDNLEVVAAEGDQLRHWFRDAQSLEWREGDLFGDNVGSSPAFIQSTYGNKGNFEVIYREGDRLRHWYRNNAEEPLEWKQGELFGQNITSAPALIQSSYGNLEVVVREGERLRHYFRTGNEKDGFEWHPGDFLSSQMVNSAPAMIESSFGNFEVVAAEGDQLRHWFRDAESLEWQEGNLFGDNVGSAPAFIQSTYGNNGNFEVIYREGDRLRHWYRDNDKEPLEWEQGELFGQNVTLVPAMIQSSYGNLEVVVREGERLRHYFRTGNEQVGFQWHEGEFPSP